MLKRVCEGLRLGLFHRRFFSGLLALLALYAFLYLRLEGFF